MRRNTLRYCALRQLCTGVDAVTARPCGYRFTHDVALNRADPGVRVNFLEY